MTSSSTTAYTLQSTLGKDRGGAKMLMWPRSDASVTPLTFPMGIGTSLNAASLLFSYLGVATHTQGSKIEATHPGVTLTGIYLTDWAASKNAVSSGQAKIIGATQRGELQAAPAINIASMVTTSQNTVSTTSDVLYGVNVRWIGASPGDSMGVANGTKSPLWVHAVQDANGAVFTALPGGILYSSSMIVNITLTTGFASVILYRKQ